MRLLLGMILGAALTVGGAYISDTVAKPPPGGARPLPPASARAVAGCSRSTAGWAYGGSRAPTRQAGAAWPARS